MSREKIKYLFNKNHIEIFKIENPEIPIPKYPVYEHRNANKYCHSHNYGCSQDKQEYKEVKMESPLGFYYIKKIKIPKIGEDFNGSISRTIITYPVPGENNSYIQLKYYTQYDDNKIGGEDGLRPWDIYPGDKDFPDHMLYALVKDVTDFFVNAKNAKIEKFEKNPTTYYYLKNERSQYMNTDDIRIEVFKELFGNINGPRFQTNDEKILAHGFDLKTSFRKDKEKK